MVKRLFFGTFAALSLLTACVPAFAAETLASAGFIAPANIDFTAALTALAVTALTCIGVLLRSLVKAMVTWIETRTKITVDGETRALIDSVLANAVGYGITRAEQAIQAAGAEGKLAVDCHNEAVQHAADYALSHIPEALAHFGVDRAGVVRMVTARMDTAGMPGVSGAASFVGGRG